MTDSIRLNAAIIFGFIITFFFNQWIIVVNYWNYIDIFILYYLNYFGKYIIIKIFAVSKWTSNLSDQDRFILLVGSSVILVRLIIDGCLHQFIDSKTRKVPLSRSILGQANGKWNNLLTRERNKISNVCNLFKSRWEGIFVSCLWIHRGRGNAVILLHSSSFFTRGNVSETLAKSFKRFHWETRA